MKSTWNCHSIVKQQLARCTITGALVIVGQSIIRMYCCIPVCFAGVLAATKLWRRMRSHYFPFAPRKIIILLGETIGVWSFGVCRNKNSSSVVVIAPETVPVSDDNFLFFFFIFWLNSKIKILLNFLISVQGYIWKYIIKLRIILGLCITKMKLLKSLISKSNSN